MKLIIALVIASLAIVSGQNTFGTCTASGDPHFTTFDGCLHDFQGQGTYQAVKNDYLQVQYHAEFCNAPANTVTCIKAVFVSFQNPNTDLPKCVVRMNVYQGATKNNATIEGVYYTWQNLTSVTCKNPDVVITKQDPYFIVTGTIKLRSGTTTWKVQAAQHQLVVTLPFISIFNGAGVTSGICGTFDSNLVNDFTASNGTVLETCVANKRVNTVKTNAWGASYFVTGANALADRSYMMQNRFTILDEPAVPNSTVQEVLNKVIFDDLSSYSNAKDRCAAMSAGNDAAVIENCVYDVAVTGDFILAASNHEAASAATTESSSSSGLNGGAVAGIVLGCIAFVSLVTAFVLYIRLRKLRTEYSRALIVRSQAQDNNASSGALAENL